MSEVLKIVEPKGFKLLIAMPPKKDKIGNIHIPENSRDREHLASICGNVISMGPLAYKDAEKFSTGPWCEVGDWVVFQSFAGRRFKIKDQEFRLINDDTVDAVVSDPRLIERAV